VRAKRRWDLRVRNYAKAREDEWGEQHRKYVVWILLRFPDIWARVGVRPTPLSPGRVVAAHVRALRDAPEWAPKTRSLYLQALRGLLRWAECPLADSRGLWALDGTALNRRWLTKGQLLAVWSACRDPLDRLVVALTGFNGLRRVEVLRLRVRDLSLALPNPELRVWGKGRNGGKFRTIPAEPRCYAALVEAADRKRPEDRVFPFEKSAFDARLSRLGQAAGLPFNLSGHALRRTFGRLAFDAGVPIATIQAIYGHASPAMTVHYVGIEGTRMAEGLAQLERFLSTEA